MGTVCVSANLVGHYPEFALLGVWALLQDIIDEGKELLHDCILPHVIITRLDLQQFSHTMLPGDLMLSFQHAAPSV